MAVAKDIIVYMYFLTIHLPNHGFYWVYDVFIVSLTFGFVKIRDFTRRRKQMFDKTISYDIILKT